MIWKALGTLSRAGLSAVLCSLYQFNTEVLRETKYFKDACYFLGLVDTFAE